MPEELVGGRHIKRQMCKFGPQNLNFIKFLHIDFGFDYFSHNKLDEPDLNLVSILDFYYFRGLQSMRQASLRCGENRVKNDIYGRFGNSQK